MSKKFDVTIFIPTYNGEKYLPKIFQALKKQDFQGQFEILVIDSGSTDKTLSIVKKYQKLVDNLRLHEIPNSEFGHGKTRNLAAQMAGGDIVVYITHDAIPSHCHWLYEITKPFELNPNVAGVIGKQDPRPGCFPLLKYEIQSVFKNFGSDSGTTLFYQDSFMKTRSLKDAVCFYSDVNSAARRQVLVNEIPYKDVPYSEDQLFGREIIKRGYIKAYAPRGNVFHSNDMALSEYKNRMFDETMGLRKVGISVKRISLLHLAKLIVTGLLRDTVKILLDTDYSWKRKLYWVVINPLYHIEKWRGVRLASKTKLDDQDTHAKHSLEQIRKR